MRVIDMQYIVRDAELDIENLKKIRAERIRRATIEIDSQIAHAERLLAMREEQLAAAKLEQAERELTAEFLALPDAQAVTVERG